MRIRGAFPRRRPQCRAANMCSQRSAPWLIPMAIATALSPFRSSILRELDPHPDFEGWLDAMDHALTGPQ